MRVPLWLFVAGCAISFFLGRRSEVVIAFASTATLWSDYASPSFKEQNAHGIAVDEGLLSKTLLWELNMRRARPYHGITIPPNNGYSAKCIPDATMKQMNAKYEKAKLRRTNKGLSDGRLHDVVPSVNQVGEFVMQNMKYEDDG
mmetsp:Transcript_8048/g.18187  ORF Transcript_8048/g.18187 Transcript_8048/m.18187 type:complete len:144 (+) Transcript_8048:51-482(+)